MLYVFLWSNIYCRLAAKQHLYPVLFLCVGVTTRYEPFIDLRSSTSNAALNFAACIDILVNRYYAFILNVENLIFKYIPHSYHGNSAVEQNFNLTSFDIPLFYGCLSSSGGFRKRNHTLLERCFFFCEVFSCDSD